MPTCPDPGTYDVSASAGLHSTLSGVLAGFAVIGLIFVLTPLLEGAGARWSRDHEYRSQQNHVVVALVCAFLGLIITTFLYAVLAGERGQALTHGRAASEELLCGIAFAFSILTLLYALLMLISVSGLSGTAHEVRALVAVVVPPLAAMFLGFAAQDFAYSQMLATVPTSGVGPCQGSQFFEQMSRWGATWLPLMVLGTCLVLWALSRTILHFDARKLPRRQSPLLRNSLPKACLILSLFAAVLSASWSERDPRASLTQMQVWACLLVAAACLVIVAAYLLWGDPGDNLTSSVGSSRGSRGDFQAASLNGSRSGEPTSALGVDPHILAARGASRP